MKSAFYGTYNSTNLLGVCKLGKIGCSNFLHTNPSIWLLKWNFFLEEAFDFVIHDQY